MRAIFYFFIFFLVPLTSLNADVIVTDDSQVQFIFKKPQQRIISLSPHITELLYAAGAKKQVVATVEYSDFPLAAKQIQRIGSYEKVDYEQILSLHPELIVYWQSGNPSSMIDGLRNLNIPLFNNEPRTFTDIAKSIEVFGSLLGEDKYSKKQAELFLIRLAEIKRKYKNNNHKKIKVFYQVWNQPLMTINKQHLVNDVIELCGGENVFAEQSNIAPTVDIESVMKKNPQIIIAGMTEGRQQWLEEWSRWKNIDAVKNAHVYAIDAALIIRQTPRILDGAEEMCELLQRVGSAQK